MCVRVYSKYICDHLPAVGEIWHDLTILNDENMTSFVKYMYEN